jgi:hypothetical protein
VAALPREIAEATAQCWPFRQASLAIGKQLRWQERNQGFARGGQGKSAQHAVRPSRIWRYGIGCRIVKSGVRCIEKTSEDMRNEKAGLSVGFRYKWNRCSTHRCLSRYLNCHALT